MDRNWPAPDASPEERWIAVGRLLRPQGRRGELLTEPLSDLPGLFAKGRQFRLAAQEKRAGAAPVVVLEDCWQPQGRNAGRLVLKLAGTDTISSAERLEDQLLCLREEELPALEEGAFLVRDLVGCVVFDKEKRFGEITDLQFPVGSDGRTRLADAADLLVVQPEGTAGETDPVLVPFVKAWLLAVDLDAKRIVMDLPPGLLE